MSKMGNLHAQQDILDKISSSAAKRADFDIFNAINRLANMPAHLLLKDGITSSRIKTMKDRLEWKQMDLYAEEHEQNRDKSND